MSTSPPSKALLWVGRVLSAIPTLMLFMSGGVKLSNSPEIVEGLGKYGFAASAVQPLGAVEILCAVLYVIPQTSVLGAILVTGYLGGATSVHVSGGEPFIAPVIIGMLAWAGLGLRDARLRQLLPLRRME